MNLKKLFVLSIASAAILSAFTPRVNAASTQVFPNCANPQGDVVASYDSGTHGVAGDTNTYSGKDTVYSISDNNYMQCLCTDQGMGIQTNWWKIYDLSQDDIQILVAQGWTFVPNGAAWGLSEGQYLVKNINFSCSGGSSSTTTNNGGPGDGLSDGRSDGRSDGLGTRVAGVSTGVLGLANTGNALFILFVFLAGISSLTIGAILNFRKNK